MLKTWWRSYVRKERDQWLQNKIRSAGNYLDISDNNIDDEDATAIANALQQNTALTTLDLSNNMIGDVGAMAIANALQRITVSTELFLWGNKIGDKGATAIANALQQNSTLTTLDLGCNMIGDESAMAIAKALERNTKLTKLYLGSNKIGDDGATAIAKLIEQNTMLTTLSLSNHNIGDKGAMAIAKALQKNTVLTELYLWGNNNIDARALSAIESMLKMSAEGRYQQKEAVISTLLLETQSSSENTQPTERSDVRKERDQWLQKEICSGGMYLDLSKNLIGNEDAIAIAKALQQNTVLTKLELGINVIADEGARAMAEALQQNTAMTYLSLRINKIGPAGAMAIAKALQGITALATLSLSGNNIGDEGATAIAEALQQNTILKKLDLGTNNIGAEGATAIAEALQHNTTLTMLNLSYNMIGNEGAMTIAKAIEQETALTELYLDNNEIGDEGAMAIEKALLQNTVLTGLYLWDNNNIDAKTLLAIESMFQMSAEERHQHKEAAISTLLLETQSSSENQPEQLDDSEEDKKADAVVVSGTNTQPTESTAVAVPPFSHKESVDLLNRLLPLADHVDPLKAVAHDQHCAMAAEQELTAIRNDQHNLEFYLSLYDSLDCTIAACQTLASGMIGQAESKTGGIHSWLVKMTKDTSLKSLKEHTNIRQVVDRSIQWAAKQIPLPFADTAGKAICVLFHTLFSLKQERQKYLAIANVAAFAVIAKHNKGGLHQTISNVCRYMVRDGRFVGTKPEFKQWQSWAAKMLADTSTTRSKAQGCLVAELVMQCIMKPPPMSAMVTILHEGADSSNVDAALTSLVLNMSPDEVVKLESFTTSLVQGSVAAGNADDHYCALSDMPDTQQGPSDVDIVALKELLQQQAQKISQMESKLSKLSNQRYNKTSVDVGNGQVQVYATSSYEEQNKTHVAGLQKEVGVVTDQLMLVTAASDIHGEQITKLVETTTDLYETVQKLKDNDVRIAKKKKGSLGISNWRPDP